MLKKYKIMHFVENISLYRNRTNVVWTKQKFVNLKAVGNQTDLMFTNTLIQDVDKHRIWITSTNVSHVKPTTYILRELFLHHTKF